MNQLTFQNLGFTRHLMRETRKNPQADMAKLRMIQGTNTGTDNLTTRRGDE